MRDPDTGPGAAWRSLPQWPRYEAAFSAMRAVLVDNPASPDLPALRREYRLAERALMAARLRRQREGKA